MKRITLIMLTLIGLTAFIAKEKTKPVFFIIGDSTVRNGDGSGKNQQWGWGSFIAQHVDTNLLNVENHAIGGRSSRTFITEGRWEKITARLKKGDYVIMQFGHNDAGPYDDTARARGSIRGIGNDSVEIYNPIRKMKEVVYSYGGYMRRYIRETKAKGAIAIVCSPVPRNDWKDGKVLCKDAYAGWAKQVAEEEGAFFIDLHELVCDTYDKMGQETIKPYFPIDHTHTNMDGAKLNAELVIGAIKSLPIKKLHKVIL